jgi:hypothetical protein
LSKLRLPWGEEISIERDVEQFSLDVMNLTAMYYIDCPDPTLVVVSSSDFKLEDEDTFVVKSCKVTLTDAFEEEEDDDRIEQIWADFILLDDSIPPRITRKE